ncbi:MAG: hypothetical protein JWL86_6672 [Rhizobium sp.]|nr:hypothetical protein [Rhizobium sp.]
MGLNPKYAKLLALLGGMYAYQHGATEWSEVHPAIRASYSYGGFLSGAAMGWLLAVIVSRFSPAARSEKVHG